MGCGAPVSLPVECASSIQYNTSSIQYDVITRHCARHCQASRRTQPWDHCRLSSCAADCRDSRLTGGGKDTGETWRQGSAGTREEPRAPVCAAETCPAPPILRPIHQSAERRRALQFDGTADSVPHEADARAVTEPAWLPAERLVCRSAEVEREGQMPKHAEKPLFDRLEQLDGAVARQLTPAMQPVRYLGTRRPDTHTSRPRAEACCPVSRADEAGRGRWLVAARVPRADLRALPRRRTHTLAQRAAWLQQCHPGPYLFIGKCSTWALKSNWTDRRYMRRLASRGVALTPTAELHLRALGGRRRPGGSGG